MFTLRGLISLVTFFGCLGGLHQIGLVTPETSRSAIALMVGAYVLSLAALIAVMTWIHDIERLRKSDNRWIAVFADAVAMLLFVLLLFVAIGAVSSLLRRM